MMGEPDHLSPATRAIAEPPSLERLAHMHGRWWINHSHVRAVLAKLEAAFTFGLGRSRLLNLLIVSPIKAWSPRSSGACTRQDRARATSARSCL